MSVKERQEQFDRAVLNHRETLRDARIARNFGFSNSDYRANFRCGAFTLRPGMSAAQIAATLKEIIAVPTPAPRTPQAP